MLLSTWKLTKYFVYELNKNDLLHLTICTPSILWNSSKNVKILQNMLRLEPLLKNEICTLNGDYVLIRL